jgi:hypothetical protein
MQCEGHLKVMYVMILAILFCSVELKVVTTYTHTPTMLVLVASSALCKRSVLLWGSGSLKEYYYQSLGYAKQVLNIFYILNNTLYVPQNLHSSREMYTQ